MASAVGFHGKTPMSVQDPLETKVRDLAEKLNRRRRTASETSEKVLEERSAFFDRLALLSAGALTFSVTLFTSFSSKNPKGIFSLRAAWICLLTALTACLVRNLTHQHYRFSHVVAERAKAEVRYIDVDDEVISTKPVAYSDSSEPFDKQREIQINRSNRVIWQQELEKWETQRERHWKLVRICEWVAAISMSVGFVLLIVFATVNTNSRVIGSPAPTRTEAATEDF